MPKREEITGGCRQLPNKEHHDLYSSSNIRVNKSAQDGQNT